MKDSKFKRTVLPIYIWCIEKIYHVYILLNLFILRIGYKLRIMSWKETLEYIIEHRCSIARFGDGEFMLMMKTGEIGFQSASDEISEKLLQVLRSDNKNLLICVPSVLNSVQGLTKSASDFWLQWGIKKQQHKKIVRILRKTLGRKYRFGDTQITRCYMDWKDKTRAEQSFQLLKHIWNDRDILIVEGDRTCLGVGNDLFANVKSISRIIAPSVDAYEKYNDILNTITNHCHGHLVLIALGPTATVLASDLAGVGIQALDIGHVDIEYEWYHMMAENKIPIPGKYTNEARNGKNVSKCEDEDYLSEIVANI